MTELENIIYEAVRDYLGHTNFQIKALPISGSNRRYFRIYQYDETFIGVYNCDTKENRIFLHMTEQFYNANLPVPKILHIHQDQKIYFLSDLGDTSLLSTIQKDVEGKLTSECKDFYKKAISNLLLFQIKGRDLIDFSLCYPRQAFDYQSMLWDLNYFKYYFVRMSNINFDEQKLEEDFNTFISFLCKVDGNFFMYRDFQSRNIMIKEGKPFFIDYQGGRKGALAYDIASLLFEAKTFIHPDDRNELLNFYIEELQKLLPIARNLFMDSYYAFAYIRLMQAMGAYGFRGLYEKKELFLQSIPTALENLRWLRKNIKLNIVLPELESIWDKLIDNEYVRNKAKENLPLLVKIISFSYKKGLPDDQSEHGGGFIFDCRAVTNPGKEEKFVCLTGKDEAVIKYLEADPSAHIFLAHVWGLVSTSIQKYILRNFHYLSISFGCTGGQHRSVFFAEKVASLVREQFPQVRIELFHRELNIHNIF